MLCVCNTCTLHRITPIEDPKYVINEIPIAWERAVPNFSKRVMYDSQKDAKFAHGAMIRHQHGSLPMYQGPLHLDIMFYFPYAKTKLLRKKQEEQQYVITTPDCDNALKFMADTCNGLLYDDDKQIASVYAAKVYDDKPRTEFNIIQLKDM